MHRKTLVALMGAIVMAVAASGVALAAGSGPAVTVQIKSLNKTLLKPTTVHGEKGWITKGGTPHGKCSGNSAAGALDAATHGKWAGKYFSSVGGVFVTSILGVKPNGRTSGRSSSTASPRPTGSAPSSCAPARSCCSRSPRVSLHRFVMSCRLRSSAVAIAVAVAIAGCGLGAGKSTSGVVTLTVTRGFGATPVGSVTEQSIPGRRP